MKRIFSLLLALLILAVPVTAFAVEGNYEVVTDESIVAENAAQEGVILEEAAQEDTKEERAVFAELETVEHIAYLSGSQDRVRPLDNLTRAEASKIIYSLLDEEPAAPQGGRFTDVKEGFWYQIYVDTLAEMGILAGYGDVFLPQNNITRAEFVTILSRFYDSVSAEVSFTDVNPEGWAYPAIATGVARGWLKGYSDGTFRPNNNITRAEAVSVINRVLGRTADKSQIQADGMILRFVDLSYDYWAYYDIMEASTPHEYSHGDTGEMWLSYTVPEAQRAEGYHLIGGELYKVDETRHYAKDAADGVLYFDSKGRYTTGNTELDAKLTAVAKEYTVEGDDAQKNLKRLYDYVLDHYTYLKEAYIDQGASGWETDRALSMMKQGKGNCYSYAAIFAMLSRKLGYQAIGQSGYITSPLFNGTSPHGWTEITLDGVKYLCDTEAEDIFCPNYGVYWNLFMQRYGTTVNSYWILDTKLTE